MVTLTQANVEQILTRTSGFLKTVSSHSLQPYRGCAWENSLCGVGCYVQHNWHVTRGQAWGSFVEARVNAAESYQRHYAAERAWGRSHRGRFGIFMSSSTEPFQPAEQAHRVTRSVLEAMVEMPPDLLIIQSHSHHIADYLSDYATLKQVAELRFHISIESDRDRLPGLPPSASTVGKRLQAARMLRESGQRVVITVAPLLPITDPHRFFADLAAAADAVVIDHYIQGDGSADGARTARTRLPAAMSAIEPTAVTLEYRAKIIQIAQIYFPGRVGLNIDGFAARFLA